jgi:hypothetical protein
MTKTSELANAAASPGIGRLRPQTGAVRDQLEAGFRTKRRRYKDAKSFSDSAELEKDLAPQSRENKAARAPAAFLTLSKPR